MMRSGAKERMRHKVIKGLGSYGNECTRALMQLPRPNELNGNAEKGEYGSKKS